MNPYDHARSSAKVHGGCWSDYHPLHAWFDLTKSAHCHFTHRALRHHVEGIAEAITIFGAMIVNSDGVQVAIDVVGRQHIEEDCRGLPRAADWLDEFALPDWYRTPPAEPEDLARTSALRFGGEAGIYLPLHRWFFETRQWVDGPAHLFFRHHAFGIHETEARFGPALTNGTLAVPTRVVAEHHVRSILGRLPAAPDVLRRIKAQRWMLQATSPASIGLA